MEVYKYTEGELIEALQEAARDVGEPLTKAMYNEWNDGNWPSVSGNSTFCRAFGSWNAAKEAAGLEPTPAHRPATMKTDYKDLDARVKEDAVCQRCGEDGTDTRLEFHHVNEDRKRGTISQMVQEPMWSRALILDEMRWCAILCKSCHRKHHSESHDYTCTETLGDPRDYL
jgi:hypothetical protein